MSTLHSGETAKAPSLLNVFIRHQHGHRLMAFNITISTQVTVTWWALRPPWDFSGVKTRRCRLYESPIGCSCKPRSLVCILTHALKAHMRKKPRSCCPSDTLSKLEVDYANAKIIQHALVMVFRVLRLHGRRTALTGIRIIAAELTSKVYVTV